MSHNVLTRFVLWDTILDGGDFARDHPPRRARSAERLHIDDPIVVFHIDPHLYRAPIFEHKLEV
jgi:hypothetical protein